MAKQVFILEDDPGIGDILQLVIEDEGFGVQLFTTVSAFNAAGFAPGADLYLLDVKLPDGNGMEVCQRLKGLDQTRQVPVMMMSAHAGLEQMQRHSGAQGHVTKPFDIYQLIDQIKSYLD